MQVRLAQSVVAEVVADLEGVINEWHTHQTVPEFANLHWLLNPREVHLVLFEHQDERFPCHSLGQPSEEDTGPADRQVSEFVVGTSHDLEFLAEVVLQTAGTALEVEVGEDCVFVVCESNQNGCFSLIIDWLNFAYLDPGEVVETVLDK